MEVDCIPFKETGYFSKIINDYLDGDEKISPYYKYQPKLTNFKDVIKNKQFSKGNRLVLSSALRSQYAKDGLKLNKLQVVSENIDLLEYDSSFTITTGHQLNLFTGPLYFLFKIASVIKLTKELKKLHPESNFIPVYWMATEDHDFEEINYFNFKGKKFQWNTDQSGAVGRMNLEGLDSVYTEFSKEFVDYSSNGEQLKKLFETAYTKHENLAAATRYLANELFSSHGLVIVDGDDVKLKKMFSAVVERELTTGFSYSKVSETNQNLEEGYKIQVNPREINLFYLKDSLRERIEKQGTNYTVVNSEISFSEVEILKELEDHPERFSPNVILRPVYQETILPNLAYIGGGGELAYWFQLKTTFEEVDVPFPMLILRNSAMIFDEKQTKNFSKLKISLKELFQEQGVLAKEWTIKNASDDLTLSKELEELTALYQSLISKSESKDKSLKAHVEALSAKNQKIIQKLSDKLIRVERKKQVIAMNRIEQLKSTLFPNGGLQERKENFSSVYLSYGSTLVDELIDSFEIPTKNFLVFQKL